MASVLVSIKFRIRSAGVLNLVLINNWNKNWISNLFFFGSKSSKNQICICISSSLTRIHLQSNGWVWFKNNRQISSFFVWKSITLNHEKVAKNQKTFHTTEESYVLHKHVPKYLCKATREKNVCFLLCKNGFLKHLLIGNSNPRWWGYTTQKPLFSSRKKGCTNHRIGRRWDNSSAEDLYPSLMNAAGS